MISVQSLHSPAGATSVGSSSVVPPGIDEKLMKPSQVLATQTNSSDVERPTEGTLEKKVTEHARRGGGQKVEPLDGSG